MQALGASARCIFTRCAGKLQAQAIIDGLRTEGSTNLIAANQLALSLALEDAACKNIHIVVLTDGEPDNKREVLPSFFRAITPLEQLRVTGHHHGACVSTFGFGYDMDSVRRARAQRSFHPLMIRQELLLQMSVAGHGMFSYIPDASMIGTVFCNFVANAMYARAPRVPRERLCNAALMCVAYPVIDVQLVLANATLQTTGADPHTTTFAVAGLQASQLQRRRTCVVCRV